MCLHDWRTNARATDSRKDPADRTGVLGLENALECHRDGCLHRAGARPGALRCDQRPPRPASSLGARLPRRPRGARLSASASGDRYANTPETDLFLDRNKPSYVGGILEMANHRLYPFWGHLTEALRTGAAAERGQDGRPRPLRNALRRSGAAEGVPRRDDRHQPRRQHDDRAQLPVEGLPDVRRRRHGAGRSRGADRAGQPAPARRRVRPAGGGADLRGIRRGRGRRGPTHVSCRAISSSKTSRKPTWC